MNPLVIVPTYNERDNIERLIRSIVKHNAEVHILVVDDGSPDGTASEIARLQAEPKLAPRLHLLNRIKKEGLGRAYISGFEWALERRYDSVIEMDADLSHDPIYISPLIEAAEHADVVIGSRYVNGISVVNWPLRRILLSWSANQYVRLITGLLVNDCTSGFRLYRRNVLERVDLPGVTSNGYSFQVEMSFRAYCAGFRIVEVPIIFTERRAGQSKMSKRVIAESFIVPIQLRLRRGKLTRQLNGQNAELASYDDIHSRFSSP